MGRLRVLALLASAFLISTGSSASAADLLEPPVIVPPPIKVGHSWYLRGHIGMSNQHLSNISHPAMSNPAFFQWLDKGDFDAAPIFGVGVGYRHNKWLRFDVVGEYRGKAHFSALDRYDTSDNPPDFGADTDPNDWGINDYTAKKSEYLIMANAYADLGTWHGFTPYVGAGLGASYNVISNYRDNNIITGGGGFAGTGGMWSLAWALHAGIGFQASDNVTLDLGYSYLDLGQAKTGTVYNYGTGCTSCAPTMFNGLISHDLKLAVRYEFDKGYGSGGGWHWPKKSYHVPEVVKY